MNLLEFFDTYGYWICEHTRGYTNSDQTIQYFHSFTFLHRKVIDGEGCTGVNVKTKSGTHLLASAMALVKPHHACKL